ncbi:MAG: hypothetical protein GXP49_08375 [Deltaproteobacteria bacterium]|nr:hypothetical protein [Deltaproteobacteria bacterium]
MSSKKGSKRNTSDKRKKKKSGRRSKGGKALRSGSLMRMRGGLKNVVSSKGKESTLSKVLTYLLLAAAMAMLLYRLIK